jgi:hypothetical protein
MLPQGRTNNRGPRRAPPGREAPRQKKDRALGWGRGICFLWPVASRRFYCAF